MPVVSESVALPVVLIAAMDGAIMYRGGLGGGFSLGRKRLSNITSYLEGSLPPRAQRLMPVFQVEEGEGGGSTVAVRLNR